MRFRCQRPLTTTCSRSTSAPVHSEQHRAELASGAARHPAPRLTSSPTRRPYQDTPYFEAIAFALASSDCQLRPPPRAAFFLAGLAAVLASAAAGAAAAGA